MSDHLFLFDRVATAGHQNKVPRKPTVGIVHKVPYVNRPPTSTTVDDGDYELHPPQAIHGSAAAAMVRRFPFAAGIVSDGSS